MRSGIGEVPYSRCSRFAAEPLPEATSEEGVGGVTGPGQHVPLILGDHVEERRCCGWETSKLS